MLARRGLGRERGPCFVGKGTRHLVLINGLLADDQTHDALQERDLGSRYEPVFAGIGPHDHEVARHSVEAFHEDAAREETVSTS